MGELDPMTLQTRYRIGKLHYLSDRKEEAMEELGDVLAKQEKLLDLIMLKSLRPVICSMKFFRACNPTNFPGSKRNDRDTSLSNDSTKLHNSWKVSWTLMEQA